MFELPFKLHNYQLDAVNAVANANTDAFGLWMGVGTGKTATATAAALEASLENTECILVICPPSLQYQWYDWWHNDVKPRLDVIIYRGSPAKRSKLDFNHDIIIMSHQIFRQDQKRIQKSFTNNTFIVYDEAHMGLRKIGNKIWRHMKIFSAGKKLLLLTATPVGNPMDTYAITKLLDPTLYPTKRAFEQRYIAEKDFFGNVTEWKNLSELSRNLYKNAFKLESNDAGFDLPDVIYSKITYELEPKHLRLYKELSKKEILENDKGEVLDATDTARKFHLLQRFVTSPDKLHIKLPVLMRELVYDIYNEDQSKMLVFSNYRNTNQSILEYLNGKGIKAVGVWGEISRKDQEENIRLFQNDIGTRVLVGNPVSMGVGLNLQSSCHRAVFTELPLSSREFEQSVGRIARQGQEHKCVVRCLTAKDTIQENLYWALLNKDDLIQQVTRKKISMRKLLG